MTSFATGDREENSDIWRVLGEDVLHDSEWLKLTLADVRLPNGETIQHRIVRYPAPTSGTLMHDIGRNEVLLIWRHRFITNHWGWEIPAGLAEPQETPEEAAIREAEEETGYLPQSLTPLITFDTSSGIMDETFHAFYASQWRDPELGRVKDIEVTRSAWVPAGELQELISGCRIHHGHSLMSILAAFNAGILKP